MNPARLLVGAGVALLALAVTNVFAKGKHGIQVEVNPDLPGVKTVTITDLQVAGGGVTRTYGIARLGGGVYTVTRINGTGGIASFETLNQTGPIASGGPDLAQLEADMRLFPPDLFKE